MRGIYTCILLLLCIPALAQTRHYNDGQVYPAAKYRDPNYKDSTWYPSAAPPAPPGRNVTRMPVPGGPKAPPAPKPASKLPAKPVPVTIKPLEDQVTDWAFKQLPMGFSAHQRKSDGGWYVFWKFGETKKELEVYSFHQHEQAAKQYAVMMGRIMSEPQVSK